MELLINLAASHTLALAPWANVLRTTTTPISIPKEDNTASGWTVAYDESTDAGLPGGDNSSGAFPTSGDASWVSDEAAQIGHTLTADPALFYRLLIKGPANTDFTLDGFSSSGFDENPKWRVNGGTVQTLAELNNTTQVVTFSASTDANGDATVEFAKGSGFCRANAIRIVTPDGPSLTITNADSITPGSTLTATASDFAAAPTTSKITDSADNELTPTPTVTADGDDYSVEVTIADFLLQSKPVEAGGTGAPVSGLLPGPCNLEVA